MSFIKVPTSFNIDVEFEIPPFYRRLLALVIDIILLYLYLRLAVYMVESLVPDYEDWNDDTGYDMRGIILLFILPIFLYYPACEITMNGQSIGKKIMGLRIVNENGGRASISQFIIRWLTRDIWFVLLFFAAVFSIEEGRKAESIFLLVAVFAYFIIDIALVVSSKKGQRLGDILARTILIRPHSKSSIEETVFQEVAADYKPSFPEIMRLSDRDINSIKGILETARRKGDYEMVEAASDKIKGHLNIHSTLSPYDFLEILLKDYNYLSTK